MPEADTKKIIKSALQSLRDGDLSQKSLKLYQTLSYNTERQGTFNEKTYRCFKESYLDGDTRFSEVKALVSEWKYVDLLFQLSKDEITPQHGLFVTKRVDRTIIETYLFFVIELSKDHYSRTALSQITRELNKVFPMPVMVLFKYGQSLTLAVINRRLHKRDERKDVLEKVTLIKDISIENPHRAHIEILFDLSFSELLRVHKFSNFVELHNAWQKTLDTKELNKRFYQELANWYFWAMEHVSFPDDVEKNKDIRNATSLIRLITRIIFIWFIKEKDLVPEALFDRTALDRKLKEFSKNKKSNNYYQAILQNLFFGTLNQKMSERSFAKEGSFEENRTNYGVKNLFRYANHFAVSEKEALALFKDIPFLNGGLFDCLDKENEEGKVLYSDGFSRNSKKQAIVPDFLFFGAEEEYDLNAVFGTKNKHYNVKGLIDILSGYKFTVAENTPVEEEVALDPELLGKVFENLLASYNPETQTTARKQTGSFNTPREIVNYMVDEALIAYLKMKLEVNRSSADNIEERLRHLFAYNDEDHLFSTEEVDILIDAIDHLKALDPAVGSDAFPMGILHKLVHTLHKLDPKNEQWKERQIQKARQIDDPAIRDHLIADIESAFENNELDYGRKLYLIENCIYGVDIQAIAVQIAKLRFFISLVVDQNKQPGKENLGIRSLPNLETKFVAANTLIGLEKPKQLSLKNPEIDMFENELKALRHRYFSAKTRKEKMACQKEDKTLRQKIAKLLEKDGWEHKTAEQIVTFDPYDQNASSPFFDPEWMFGIKGGFDVVIGNPPYFNINTINKDFVRYLSEQYKVIHTGYNDIVYYFIYLGVELLSKMGCCVLITSNYYLGNEYAKKLRSYLARHTSKIINFKDHMVFEAASIHTCISISYKEPNSDRIMFFESASDKQITSNKIEEELTSCAIKRAGLNDNWIIADSSNTAILEKITKNAVLLGSISTIKKGATSGDREIFTVLKLFAEKSGFENELLKTSINSKDIKRYVLVDSGEYLIYIDNSIKIENYPNIYKYFLKHQKKLSERNEVLKGMYTWYRLERPREKEVFDAKEKLVVPYRAESNTFAYDNNQGFNDGGGSYAIVMKEGENTIIKYLLGILNSKLMNWFYGFIGKPKGKVREYFNGPLSLIPIKKVSLTEQRPFINVVDAILYPKLKNPDTDTFFLERLIDAMVYELYFPDEIKAAGCEVMKHLGNLPELKDGWSNEQKRQTIEKVYKELSDPAHPVSVAMEKMKTVPEVRIIEGLGKNE